MNEEAKYPLLHDVIIVFGDIRIKKHDGQQGRFCDVCQADFEQEELYVCFKHDSSGYHHHIDCYEVVGKKMQEALEEHRMRLLVEGKV